MATLTASNSLLIQTEVNRMWSEKTASGMQYENPVSTVAKLIKSQNLRYRPVMDDAGRCISWKVWYTDLADAYANEVYEGSVPNPDAECALTGGSEIGTQSKTYNPNVYIDDQFQVNDDLCGNDATFAILVADQLNASMQKIRNKLNERAILALDTNKTANVDDSGASDEMTISGAETIVPKAVFGDASILAKFGIIAESNRMGSDFLIMDGTNMLLSKDLAPYLGLNDDNRSTGKLYADIGMRYNSDLRDMARITEDRPTFLVNPNMIGFFNQTRYGLSPVTIDATNNKQVFKIRDPFLRYRRVDVNVSGAIIGISEAPVEYDVIYEKSCSGQDARGYDVFNHIWKVRFVGGIVIGPEADSGATNILKFVQEGGV